MSTAAGHAAQVTLVEGASFAVSATDGDIGDGADSGLYHRDTRVLSRLRVLVDGRRPEPLSTDVPQPFSATFLGLHRTGEAQLLVERHRFVGEGMREDLVLRNVGAHDLACRLVVEVDADLADQFSVRAGSPQPLDGRQVTCAGGEVSVRAAADGRRRGVVIGLDGATGQEAGGGAWLEAEVLVPARGRWTGTLLVRPVVDEESVAPAYPVSGPVDGAEPVTRFQRWLADAPRVATPDEGLRDTLARSVADLGALRVRDTDLDGAPADVVAAGAPWYMTLFGRDSLLTSWMALPLAPGLALSTLRVLARSQGSGVDPVSEEEPGRIVHETRHGTSFPLAPGRSAYYGTADATPLFCMLVGELHRWGTPPERLAPLMPYVDRALDWALEHGDRDGDGFVEYARATEHGLWNQGWKDSPDAVTFADGRDAEPPIALAEVQAYVYGAFVARSELAREFDGDAEVRAWAGRAAELRARFHEAFWLPEARCYALALDGEKQAVDAVASNMGHCLWTGLVEETYAGAVAAHLLSPEMFSGWGVRTLSTAMARYDPMSYHNGSVWPHDSAICAAGLARYGFAQDAWRVARGVLDAARAFGGRLPELFCGFDRGEFRRPVPYPTSCSPQAWAAAAPLLLLRAGLGFEPDLPRGTVGVAAAFPEDLAELTIRDVPLGGRRVRLTVAGGAPTLEGVPGVRLDRPGGDA